MYLLDKGVKKKKKEKKKPESIFFMLIVYTLIFQLYDWFSSYCGIIFIRDGGGQCSLVAKICLVHGNVISLVASSG